MVMIAIVNSFFVPIEMAFQPGFACGVIYSIFNSWVETLFFIDMVVTSITSYRDSRGVEVKEVKKII